jgi:hypothetical protein
MASKIIQLTSGASGQPVLRRESSGWGPALRLGSCSARINRELRRAGRTGHSTLSSAGLAT